MWWPFQGMSDWWSAHKDCPFCHPKATGVWFEGMKMRGIWDNYPVSPGHALVVPRRHLTSWFGLTLDEHRELVVAVNFKIHEVLRQRGLEPDGFNIGLNAGVAAGQTVPHIHLHVIPRYTGDDPHPRGGIRKILGPGDWKVEERK